ncbi:hypothetical protein EON65_30155 [archaeon]|nr:MAG: hypothetical protein EON65_30155 [archaeon]
MSVYVPVLSLHVVINDLTCMYLHSFDIVHSDPISLSPTSPAQDMRLRLVLRDEQLMFDTG